MELEIEPTPTAEEEAAIRAALDPTLARRPRSAWAQSALDDLRDDAPLQDPGRDTRVVEP
jgi:hypothetical protein